MSSSDALPDVFGYEVARRFVADRRKAMGLTVREVSRRAGIRGETWVSQIEQGTRRLVEPNLGRLAALFGMSEPETRLLALLAQRDEAEAGPLREDLDRRVAAAKAARGGGAGAVPAIGLVRAGEPTSGEAVARARAAQRRAAEVLEALEGPDRPRARFLGVSQASSASGVALAERALAELAEELRGASRADGPLAFCAQLELFPLTRALHGAPPTAAARQVPSVIEHHHAAAFLVDWLEARGRTRGWLAGRLQVARSTVTRGLERGQLSAELGERVAAWLLEQREFTEDDAALFRLMVARDAAEGPHAAPLQEAIATLRVQAARRERQTFSDEILGDWRCAAIADLPLVRAVRADDHAAIGASLEPPISPDEAAQVLRSLTRARLMRVSDQGLLVAQPAPIWLRRQAPPGEVDPGALASHRAMQTQGARRLQALERAPGSPDARWYTLDLRGADEDLTRWMGALSAAQRRVAFVLGDQATRADRVVQVNLQLFPAG